MHIANNTSDPEFRNAYRRRKWAVKNHTPLTFRLDRIKINLLFVGRHTRVMHVEEVSIPRADSTMLRLCLYRPHKQRENVLGLLWIHGGFAMGCPEQEEILIGQFVEASGCFVVSPDHRLSINVPYPATLDDCYLALHWPRNHAEENSARKDQLFVTGGSGGGLTAALTLYARDKGEIAVAFQMPWYPMIDPRMITPSSAGDDVFWTARSNGQTWKLYLGKQYGREDLLIYAAHARATDLSGLPPTCTFIGSVEIFSTRRSHVLNGSNNAAFRSISVSTTAASIRSISPYRTFKIAGRHSFYIERFAYAAGYLFVPQPEQPPQTICPSSGMDNLTDGVSCAPQ